MIRQHHRHPRGTRTLSAKVFVSLLVSALVAGPWCALGADQAAPVASYRLLPGVTAEIQADGGLVLLEEGTGSVILTASVPALGDARRLRRGDQGTQIVRDRLAEGVLGGKRGFSDGADDDGDGLVDEDRRDGRDNDHDGLVDEDFAAIGDDMTVVHRREGGGAVHQESYHWSNPGLKPVVFLSLAAEQVEAMALKVAAGGRPWVEAEVSALRHSPSGHPATLVNHPFVTRVEKGTAGAGEALWLAVMVLDERPGYRALGVDRFTRLDFPLSDGPLPLAVVAARSWGQLTHLLSEAELVFRGVADPLNQRSAAWILPAPCSLCRNSGVPAFSRHAEGERGLVVEMHLTRGQSALVDPELFTLGGTVLGSPDALVWRPATGQAVARDWTPATLASLMAGEKPTAMPCAALGALAGHGASGVLEFHFTLPEKGLTTDGPLGGVWLDGRPFRTDIAAPGKPAAEPLPVLGLAAVGATQPGTADARASLDAENHPPTLAPELLEGWPNPFRDQIRIKFKVPRTVGEAFVWTDDDAPKNLDAQAAVPWEGGSPSASVKIYNINGQELRTLYDGSAGEGEFTVSWNGTDISGRQVASGTYFCKLQLDEWSVTRRLVYLR